MQTPVKQSVGELIRKARIAKGYSQERLAICVGYQLKRKVYQFQISHIESGRRDPTITEAIAISAVLGGIYELSRLIAPPQSEYTVKGDPGVPVALIREMADAGYTCREIGQIAGIPPQRVEALLNFFERQ